MSSSFYFHRFEYEEPNLSIATVTVGGCVWCLIEAMYLDFFSLSVLCNHVLINPINLAPCPPFSPPHSKYFMYHGRKNNLSLSNLSVLLSLSTSIYLLSFSSSSFLILSSPCFFLSLPPSHLSPNLIFPHSDKPHYSYAAVLVVFLGNFNPSTLTG